MVDDGNPLNTPRKTGSAELVKQLQSMSMIQPQATSAREKENQVPVLTVASGKKQEAVKKGAA